MGKACTDELKVTDACPWATKCVNSENQCQPCNKSPFPNDDRCVCGPGSADWIHKGECKACTDELKVTGPCSWATKCVNSENQCQPCNASPFANDDRCVCGPGSADWIHQGECKACTDELKVTDACPWGTKCVNSENQCQTCNKSPFPNDDRCVCGPGSADWIHKGECKACTDELKVTDACPW